MKLPNGLYAIPPGIDCDAVFADTTPELNGKSARERVFYMINEFMADSHDEGADSALNELAAVLGTDQPTEPKEPAKTEKARIRARRAAREACTRALEAGYNP
ncbi:hypothetical protein EDF68_104118 [Ochrobactrum sp. BH3]|nr:hypothetical protein EDF68_104118 [Ochrobactrum sp. BH3]